MGPVQCTIALAVLVISVAMSDDAPQVYSGQSSPDGAVKMKILRKPGDCHSHPDYPNTIQCAETDQCISFKQFNNSKCDCCGPTKDCSSCPDHSDENRVAPPGGIFCKDVQGYALGAVYQCALHREICISRFMHWNNGRCDCCPEQDYVCGHPNCVDHSDEECLPWEWDKKFTCDGNCIAIEKFADNETDCWSDCTIESNVVAKAACEAKKQESAAFLIEDFCNKMAQKNNPYFRCTSGDKQCIPASSVRDNRKDCANGEDENPTTNPDCPATVKSSKCDPNVSQCVLINNKSDSADCRCPGAGGTLDNCNKDRPSRRRRIF